MITELGDNAEPNGPNICVCANECLASFQNCLFSAASIHPRELSMVEDQLARFSSWANGIGVFAPGSASMDHRLRYAPDVAGVVIGLLESLNYRCQSLLKMLISVIESSNQDNVNEGFHKALMDVASEISRLNKISNTIRRASKDAQAHKVNSFQIKDDEGNDVEDFLRQQFKHHICDRFPSLGEVLQERLARTMLLRRKHILYRRHRQGNATVKPQKTEAARAVELPNAHAVVPLDDSEMKLKASKKSALAVSSQVKSATTLAPEKFLKAAASPSVISASKTVALGSHETLIFPPAPGFALKERYEQLNKQKDFKEHGTVLPSEGFRSQELIGFAEITCPYCLSALPAKEIFNDEKWQNHVINDLDAYVCLFDDCDEPDALYSHSDEWLSHLQQHHRFWRCNSHRELDPFTSSAEYISHMRNVHSSKLSDNQLRIMANRNSRKMPKLFPSCPLCGKDEDEVSGRLEDHLAGHLRSLALKSLPSYEDETPEDIKNDNDSIDISRPQSRSTVREMRQAKGALSMATLRSDEFWDLWNPDVPQHAGVNFLGDPHTELENATVSFSAYSFKDYTSSPESDPVLQSMLSKKRTSAYYREMMTHKFEEGDIQVSGSRLVLVGDVTSTGNNHKPETLQKGKHFHQNTMFDDGEDVPQQQGVSSEGNGYLIFTIKDLQYLKPRRGVPGSRDGLICEASYGDEVSLLIFQAKGQVRDNTMILEVPYDVPKSLKLSILSGPITNMRMLSDEVLGTIELDVLRILSTNYTYSDVHKLFEQGNDGAVNNQTVEISFDISWQLKDPRTFQKTQGAGHSDLNGPSEMNQFSTVIQDDLPISPTKPDPEYLKTLEDSKDRQAQSPVASPQHKSSREDGFEANYGEPSRRLSAYESKLREKRLSDLYSQFQGNAQVPDTRSIAGMPELPTLPYDVAFIRKGNSLIPRKLTKKEKEDEIIEREVFDLQRFPFQELYAQKEWVEQSLEMGSLKERFWLPTLDRAKLIFERSKRNQSLVSASFNEGETNTAEVRRAVELSLREIQEAIQALGDYRDISEDERNVGRGPTILLDTTAVNDSTLSPLLLGIEESGEPSQRRRHSPPLEAKDEEAQKERLRDRVDSPRIAAVGKKSGRKSPSSPTRTNTGPPRWSEDYRKLSPRHARQVLTPDTALRWPMPPPSASPASTQRKEKPESDPLPRRKKGDTKRDKKEWDSD